MGEVKRLPYGISDFADLRRENKYCVDKSMYIPKLEETGDFLFLIRPRRFGKSIFLSMLRNYYDIERQDRFDELFDGLWIHENPTKDKGKFQIVYFDFSLASSSLDKLEETFHCYCSDRLNEFAHKYAKYYDDGFVEKVESMGQDSVRQLNHICIAAREKGYKLYLIIDEYDNFTNNVLNEKGEAVYHALTHASGFYREVFKKYKPNFQRILMMGVSPVTMDDLTSGFNVSLNISTNYKFNMMLGFSETDVREMIEYYRAAGQIKADTDSLIADMKPWYDNYCFAVEGLGKDPRVYNCDMVVYYLRNVIESGEAPRQMIDPNTKTDYTKMKKLIFVSGTGGKQHEIIRQIATEGKIISTLNLSFPAERIYDENNFISLLFYYGMLTMSADYGTLLELSVPNNNVRKQYYEYLLEEFKIRDTMSSNTMQIAFWGMALHGDWRQALQMIADLYAKNTTVRSLIQGESNINGFMTAMLSLDAFHFTAPELGIEHGYCDLMLMPDHVRYPQVAHSYIIELKYLKTRARKDAADKQWTEAEEQIRKYASGEIIEHLRRGTKLHLIIMQFKGYKLLRMEEIDG